MPKWDINVQKQKSSSLYVDHEGRSVIPELQNITPFVHNPHPPITAHMLNKITRLYFISLSKQKDNVIKPQRDQNIDDTRVSKNIFFKDGFFKDVWNNANIYHLTY